MPRPPPTSRYAGPAPARARIDVDARGFVHRALDLADIGDLAAQVEVQQLEAIGHAEHLQLLQRAHGLGGGKAELRAVAARRFPAARTAAGQLDAHADHGARPRARLYFRSGASSVYFSTTGMICGPIFCASMAISMYSSSLKPLQMIGVSLSASAITASSSAWSRLPGRT
jgi:hypothetical protein